MDPVPTERTRAAWLLVPAIWLALGLVDATQTVIGMRAEGMHHSWGRVFLHLILSWVILAVATPFILWIGRRLPITRATPIHVWFMHLAACVGIALAHSAWMAALQIWIQPWAPQQHVYSFVSLFALIFLSTFHLELIAYASIIAIGQTIESRRKLRIREMEAAQLNALLSRAQLDALRHQLEPHFLFNTLNTLAGLVRERRNDAAVTMIAGLSDLLRRAVNGSNRQEITLGEELEFLERYLEIQKVRFAERLQVTVDVPADLYPAQVPSLMLQPMVENAIRHGICRRVQGGTIRIAARNLDGTLIVTIHNDGPSLQSDPLTDHPNRQPNEQEASGSGIGLANVRSRLHSLYGSLGHLSIENHQYGGVEVSLSMPHKAGVR